MSDFSSKLIKEGLDSDTVLKCANNLSSNYLGEGVKIRKKPTPRAPKAPGTTKSSSTTKSCSKPTPKTLTWEPHPGDPENYSFTRDIVLKKGLPVRYNKNKKVVYVGGKDEVYDLEVEDAMLLSNCNLVCDMSFAGVPKAE
ncbi:hypothetical protein K493DRAFT_304212 [Basidiobolus meristosporus CBS 931.73]|uniref:Uncharacterized protein n=1 Tax=Basidiobolus meristosporus CBS 931.73 TaxID=1314790 RepID=A0A1Y1XZQ2_9FUNG|nr:hypothetical protein K493DRAFT_304212 [Basidiobolus meristosporus CBS 931.73]|eukprot:ORX91243.1 hypothetical protein K493DRAFT_304212 [Basidiobolus meristosporus CBS 931.73]